MKTKRSKIIIIGAGFGGLHAARTFSNQNVDVLIIDRHNYHTFTPLLYQVATSGLDPSEISYPIRTIFRYQKNVNVMLGNVTDIDHEQKFVRVQTNGMSIRRAYDYLIIAAGSKTNFFDNQTLAQFSFGLKNLSDAVKLRNHILRRFELAVWEQVATKREALTTIVVVGGGPTGLETAGAVFELYNYVLKYDFRTTEPLNAKVILLEAQDNLLLAYPEKLQKAAYQQLTSLGVEVKLGSIVDHVENDRVVLKDGTAIPTYTLVWAAGVKGEGIAHQLGVELARGDRIPIHDTLEVKERSDVYAIGDIAYLINPKDDQPYPQMIPVANQQGKLVAKNILARIKGEPQQKFTYFDKGIMATIGRSRAVAYPFYRLQLTGWLAWVTWLILHLIWLMGFRNQISVFVSWVWNYFTYDRSVRIILEHQGSDQVVSDLSKDNDNT